MDSNYTDAKARALFLADSHFHVERSPAEEFRMTAFIDILDQYKGIEHVVLLGDIVDFWFDYPHFMMKGYEPILTALDRVREAGSRLHFIGGNHDIWAADFLHRRYATAPQGEPVTLELDGQRIFCTHGDGLLGRDFLYKGFRAVVRHPAGVLIAKSLHPELLYAFSTWLSGHSRHSTRDEAEGIENKARRWLERHQDVDWDHLIMGHVHHPFTTEAHGRRMTTLGGWLDPLQYAIWSGGELHQCTVTSTGNG